MSEIKANDFVTRLRTHRNRDGSPCEKEDCIACGSANEIESLRQRLKEAERRLAEMTTAEHNLSDAYLRIRALLNAWDTPHAPTPQQIWEHTENKLKEIISRVDTPRDEKSGY